MGEMFLKLQGIDGESLDEASPIAHKDEIEIKTWTWNTECKVLWEMNQGGQSTKAEFGSIKIDKLCDKATVNLYQYCVTGKHIPTGKLTCRKNDGDQKVEYLVVELKDIMISHVEFQGDGEATALKESVHLSFAEFKMKYSLQKDLGQAGGATEFGYHIQKMKAV
jgi:type VI secretion system secreted protein Hcp